MKKLWMVSCLCTAFGAFAQQKANDSIKLVKLQEAQVVSTRANKQMPVAYSELKQADLKTTNAGRDLPFLLSTLPSVVTTSDAGNGLGYTSMTIRGVDPTRINITTNGIPLNDSESQAVFFVNMGDFASSLSDIQVQRGVGTSTNGAAAFGATVNLQTEAIGYKPYVEFAGSAGSFNTHKATLKFGTGLLKNHWGLSGRVSHIGSEGYRDRASANLFSYFVQAGYFNHNTSLKWISFGGNETTYHAWDGISKEELKTNRRYNPNGEIVKGGKVVGFYPNQNDVYEQYHNQLLFTHNFNPALTLNAALHYTRGKGYYEEYKNSQKIEKYQLAPFNDADGNKVKKLPLIRRKHLDNHFYGTVFSLNYRNEGWNASFGGGLNNYTNDHFGQVIEAKGYTPKAITEENPFEYYRNKGKKMDGNIYAKTTYSFQNGLSVYGDLQYRYIHYTTEGLNDKYNSLTKQMQTLDINEKYHFFNPKTGLTYQINPTQKVFASAALARREPKRKDFTEGFLNRSPKSEWLFDYELGYTYQGAKAHAGVNLYFMDYKDQLVLTGKINEIGEAVSENVGKSYRAGVELTAGVNPCKWFSWEANATFSKNVIKNYTGYLLDENWDNEKAFEKGETTIAMSPSVVANNLFVVRPLQSLSLGLQTQYVGKMYLDNFQNEESSLAAYCVSNLNINYKLPKLSGTKEVNVGCNLYNLFDTKYATNGYSQTVYQSTGGGTTFLQDPRFYPMAGFNFLAYLSVRF